MLELAYFADLITALRSKRPILRLLKKRGEHPEVMVLAVEAEDGSHRKWNIRIMFATGEVTSVFWAEDSEPIFAIGL